MYHPFRYSYLLLWFLFTSTNLFAVAGKENPEEERGEYCYHRAWLYNSQQPDSAVLLRKYLKEALQHFEKAGVRHRHTQALGKIGTSLFYANQLDSAKYYLKKALDERYLKHLPVSRYEFTKNLYHFLYEICYLQGTFHEALSYANTLREQACKEGDEAIVAQSDWKLAETYYQLKEFGLSQKFYLSAAKLYEQLGEYGMAGHFYDYAAVLLSTVSQDHEQALSVARRGLACAQEAGDTTTEADCYNIMAIALDNLGKYDESIAHYRKSAQLFEAAGNRARLNDTRKQMMVTFNKAEKVDSARLYLHRIENVEDANALDTAGYPKGTRELSYKLWRAESEAAIASEQYSVLHGEYLERKAAQLRQRIWFLSALSLLAVVALLLLYARQRQKTRAEKMSRIAGERERDYQALQNQAEMRLVRKYIDGLESERDRLSKELHDGVCNDLLALEMELKRVAGGGLERQLAFLSRARENIRHVSHELMPPAFQHADIDEMLSDYAAHIDPPQGMQIEYHAQEGVAWSIVPDAIAYEVYRVAQEALSNSIKHASASRIEVSLLQPDTRLVVEIRDNGAGFDRSHAGRGMGLRTMEERVKSVAGEIAIDTGAHGTNIKAIFKL